MLVINTFPLMFIMIPVRKIRKIEITDTEFLLIRAPSLKVAPPPEKPINHDNLVNII